MGVGWFGRERGVVGGVGLGSGVERVVVVGWGGLILYSL